MQHSLKHFLKFLVNLHEVQYRATQRTTPSMATKKTRGPYKRDERVIQDEELMARLKAYTGLLDNFVFDRQNEQKELFEKFKEGRYIENMIIKYRLICTDFCVQFIL